MKALLNSAASQEDQSLIKLAAFTNSRFEFWATCIHEPCFDSHNSLNLWQRNMLSGSKSGAQWLK